MEDKLITNLKAILWRFRWRFAGSFCLVLLSNLFQVVNPFVFREAIHAVGAKGEAVHPFFTVLFGSHVSSVWGWSILLVVIALISAVFKYLMRIGFFHISRQVEKELRSKLFEKIQAQSMAFYDRHGTGELLSRLTNDISSYREVMGFGLMYPLFFVTIVFPALTALFMISTKLALLTLIPIAIIPLFNQTIRGNVYSLSLGVQKMLGDLSNLAQEHYSGIRIVKGYGIEQQAESIFAKVCRELVRHNLRLVTLLGMIFPLFTMLTKLIVVLVVLMSGLIITKAWGELSTGDFVAFMWIQSFIFFPILILGWVLPIYARGNAAYHRLFEVYREPIEVHEGTHREYRVPPKADIVFKDLSFTYPQAINPALEHITLTVKGGSFVGLTGPVGAGKTTLFRLLNREYEIPRGRVFIGGHDICDYPLMALREAMVTVEQAPFLFSKSIADNVRFGKEEATQMELERVAAFADLHETILEFSEKYETVIGEKGVTLSGGQKQRVALARAFLVNRSILLLDDVFSALDASTEKRIFASLKGHFAGKTVLLITHRVSILEQMDRVVYFQEGKIVEDGAPSELLEGKGLFAALAELQSFEV